MWPKELVSFVKAEGLTPLYKEHWASGSMDMTLYVCVSKSTGFVYVMKEEGLYEVYYNLEKYDEYTKDLVELFTRTEYEENV